MSIEEQARAAAEREYGSLVPERDRGLVYPVAAVHGFRTGAYVRGYLAGHGAATRTRVVTTVAELDALPVGSVVLKRPEDAERIENSDGSWSQGAVAELRPNAARMPAWFTVGSTLGFKSHQADLLPAIVLFNPEEGRCVDLYDEELEEYEAFRAHTQASMARAYEEEEEEQ